MKEMHLGSLDIAILVGYVVALASIGWWAARKAKGSTADYFLASRSIPWLVTTASFLATITSALTFVGTPAEGFKSNYGYVFSNVGDILATLFVAMVFLPVYQSHGVTSIYEYIATRFGRGAQTTCAGYFLVSRMLGSTVRIVAIAKVLEVVSGEALEYTTCVVITVAVILVYTTIGGGRAIAWTDLLQFFLLVGGGITALVYIVSQLPGGLGEMIEAGRNAVKPDGTTYNKFNFLEPFKPENIGLFFLLAVWGFFQSCAAYGTDQDMTQRLLACNNPRKARWSLMLSGVSALGITLLFLTLGVALYAYSRVDASFIEGMKSPDHVFPRFIMFTMPEGLKGLMLAAVASAAMGSTDSALASLATSWVVDFHKPFFGRGDSEERCVVVSKIAFVAFGLLMMCFAIVVKGLDDLLWLGFRMVAFTYGPLLGVFAVAVLTDWKVPSRRLLPLMFGITFGLLALGITAFLHVHWGAKSGFWFDLHDKYWKLYVIVGALLVPLACWFLREPDPQPRG